MAYADYSFYRDVYLGSTPENAFPFLAEQAAAYLDRLTFGRAGQLLKRTPTPLTEPENSPPDVLAIRKACCAVVDELYRLQTIGDLQSENTKGYSVAYRAGESKGRRIRNAAALWLPSWMFYKGI